MNTARRCLSAILLIYVALYALTLVLGDLYGVGRLSGWWLQAWNGLAAWIGIHAWHLPRSAFANDFSGDSPLEFGRSLAFALVALLGGTLWGILDTREVAVQGRLKAIGVLLRLGLATDLFKYGFIKVFPAQFPMPDGGTMMQNLGDFTPQSLYWATVGAAPAYQVFAGVMETTAGLLLVFRRTALVGALLAAGVMANVVMVNLAYDIPVKLRALHLFGMALILAALEWRKVWSFISDSAMPASSSPAVPAWARGTCLVLFAWAALGAALPARASWHLQLSRRAGPLVGSYELESLSINGVVHPPLLTDPSYWKSLWIADLSPVLIINRMDGTDQGFYLQLDTDSKTLKLHDPSIQGVSILHYSVPDDRHLTIEGQLGTEAISAKLRKLDEVATPLRSEGFHWMED